MATTILNPLYPRPHISQGTSSVAAGKLLSVASSGTATSFTANMFTTDCQLVFFDVQTNPVVVTFDGSTPLFGTSGHILASGTNYTWQLATLLDAKFVTESAITTAQLYASQFAV